MSHQSIGRFHMRKFFLIAAMAVGCAAAAQAGDSRSLSVAGMDEKLPAALGKAAGAPKIVEAPKPPDPPKPPETPKAAETAKPAEEPRQTGTAIRRAARRRQEGRACQDQFHKDGQVTFEEKKPAAAKDNAAVEAKPATEATTCRRERARAEGRQSRQAASQALASLERSADHARTPPLRCHGRRLGRLVSAGNKKSPRR